MKIYLKFVNISAEYALKKYMWEFLKKKIENGDIRLIKYTLLKIFITKIYQNSWMCETRSWNDSHVTDNA